MKNARRKRMESKRRKSILPSSLPHPPTTTGKGSCSRRTACRLTRHIIIPAPLVSPVSTHRPSCYTASSRPRCPSSPLVLDLFTLPSSPIATLRASIRAGQQPLRQPVAASSPRRGAAPSGGGNMAALAHWIHYGRVA